MAGALIRQQQALAIPMDTPTISEYLTLGGNYRSYMVGKWHVGHARESNRPLARGFLSFFGFLLSSTGYFWPRKGLFDNYRHVKQKYRGHYLPHVFQRKVKHTLKTHSRHHISQPFFLYYPLQLIHGPLQALQEDLHKFNVTVNGTRVEDRCLYSLAMMHQADKAVGLLREQLKEFGFANNTVLIVTSDNGGPVTSRHLSSNLPYRGGKVSMFEGGIRTLALVHAPGQIEPRVCHHRMFVTDWLPTIVEGIAGVNLLDVHSSNNVSALLPDGVNQWPWNSSWSERKRDIVTVRHFKDGAILKGNWKLVFGKTSGNGFDRPNYYQWPAAPSRIRPPDYLINRTGSDDTLGHSDTEEVFLFDIDADPYEHHNVAEDHPHIVCTLHKRWRNIESAHAVAPQNGTHLAPENTNWMSAFVHDIGPFIFRHPEEPEPFPILRRCKGKWE